MIPDLHAAPGGQTGINHDDGPGYPLMFYVPRDRDLTVKLWRAVAQRYSGNPTILGYDILNEPIAPYHDVATLNARLEPFYKRATAAIREVDPGRIVILAGGQWSSSFAMFGPPFAKNLAYTYHSFWASTKRDSIQRHLNFANLYDVPLFLGETGELTDEWNERFRKLHEQARHRMVVLDVQEPRHAVDDRVDPAARRAGPRSWPMPTASGRTSRRRKSSTAPSPNISTA